MSAFLDAEALDKVGDILKPGPKVVEEPVLQNASEPQVEAQEEEQSSNPPEPVSGDTPEVVAEVSSTPTEETKAAPEADSDKESSGSHRVPYNRFKKVIDSRNKFQTENDSLRSRLKAMEEQVKSFQSQPPAPSSAAQKFNEDDDSWLDEPYVEEDEQAPPSDWQKKYNNLESRVQAWEFEEAKRQVQDVVAEAGEKYPAVPKQALLEWIVKNPPRSGNLHGEVLAVAERFSAWIAQVEEAGIARYVEGNKKTQARQGGLAAPRPAKSSGKSSTAKVAPKGDKPKTLKESKAALMEFLDQTNPFR